MVAQMVAQMVLALAVSRVELKVELKGHGLAATLAALKAPKLPTIPSIQVLIQLDHLETIKSHVSNDIPLRRTGTTLLYKHTNNLLCKSMMRPKEQ